jgi:hypothetical protein
MLQVIKWVNHAWRLNQPVISGLLVFSGSSTPERKDWILPVDSFSLKEISWE